MKKVGIGCLIVALLMMAAIVATVLFWLLSESPLLDATLSIPPEVEVGTAVEMVVTVKNDHDVPVTLDSIDIDNSFLSGFQVAGIDPEPQDTMHVPFLDQRSWDFGAVLQPGESLSVKFQLAPIAEGHFVGDVDVCNPSQDFKTLLADVVVKAKSPD